MDKQYLREKLDAMRQNFVESTHHERAVGSARPSAYEQKNA